MLGTLAKVAAGVVVALLLVGLALTVNGYMWLALPAFAVVVVFVVGRQSSFKTTLMAGLIGYAFVLGFAAVSFGLNTDTNRANNPDCDGFCMTPTQSWILFLFIAQFVAVPAGIVSAIIAGLISVARRRAARTQVT